MSLKILKGKEESEDFFENLGENSVYYCDGNEDKREHYNRMVLGDNSYDFLVVPIELFLLREG